MYSRIGSASDGYSQRVSERSIGNVVFVLPI
jgi:hypothetical protein